MGWIIFLGLIAVVVFWVIGAYNRLVSLRNLFKNAFAQEQSGARRPPAGGNALLGRRFGRRAGGQRGRLLVAQVVEVLDHPLRP